MNCPVCGYKMGESDLDCPRCVKFGLNQPSSSENTIINDDYADPFSPHVNESRNAVSGIPSSSTVDVSKQTEVGGSPVIPILESNTGVNTVAQENMKFKQTTTDIVMKVLIVFVLFSQRGYMNLVVSFYLWLFLIFSFDTIISALVGLINKIARKHV